MNAKSRRYKVAAVMPEEFDAYRKWLGIPPEDQPPDHYRLLGITPFEDDPDVIENAANRQMGHIRTFQSGKHGRLSQKILNEISTAKICLLNPAKKADYDAALRGEPVNVAKVEIVEGDLPEAPPLQKGGLPEVAPPQVEVGAAPRAVVVVGAASRARRAKSAARTSHSKQRSNLLPIVLLVVCALVMLAAVTVAMNWNALKKLLGAGATGASAKQNGEPKGSKRDTSTAPAPVEKPEKKPSPKPAPKPAKVDDGFQPHPTIPPLPAPLSKAEREKEFERVTVEARRALEERKLESAAKLLVDADSFKTSDKDQATVLHLRTFMGLLGEFWHDVRRGIYVAELGKSFEFSGEEFEIVRREGELLTYKAAGEEHTGHVRELAPKAALAFARRAPDHEKPRALLSAATFLAFEARGGSKEREGVLAQARKMWHEAARLGVKDADLARELGIDPSVEPEADGNPDS